MRFSPKFQLAGEHRPLFFAGAEAPQPPQQETPDQNRAEVKNAVVALIEQLKTDPKNEEVVRKLEIAKAEMDANKDQATCEAAVDRAASAYYRALGRGPQALAKVSADFNAVSPGYQLKDPEGAKKSDNPENAQEKQLTPEQEKLVKDLVSIVPDSYKKAAEGVIREMVSNPETAAIAQKTFDAFVALSPEAKMGALRGEATPKSSVNLPALPPQVQQEVDQFKKNVGPEGVAFMVHLRGKIIEASQEQEKPGAQLTPEERENAMHEGEKLLAEFEKIKSPTELDRNIILAQLQIKGIDVREPDTVFDKNKKPEERFKMLEGSNVERGIYQLLGIVSYVVLSLQKFKEAMNPEEKRKKESTAATPGKGPAEGGAGPANVGKEGVRKMMKDAGKTAAQLIAIKDGAEKDSKKKIDGDEPAIHGLSKDLLEAKVVQTARQAKVDELKGKISASKKEDEKQELSAQLITGENELKNAMNKVDALQQQLTQEQNNFSRLEGEIQSIKNVQDQTSADKVALEQVMQLGAIRLAMSPKNAELTAIVKKMNVEKSENGIDLNIVFDPPEARDKFVQLCDQRKIDFASLNVEIDKTNNALLIAKDSPLFRGALEQVMAKSPEAATRAPEKDEKLRQAATVLKDMDQITQSVIKDSAEYKDGSYLGSITLRPVAARIEKFINALNAKLNELQSIHAPLSLAHLIEEMNTLEFNKPQTARWGVKDYIAPPPIRTGQAANKVVEEISLLLRQAEK